MGKKKATPPPEQPFVGQNYVDPDRLTTYRSEFLRLREEQALRYDHLVERRRPALDAYEGPGKDLAKLLFLTLEEMRIGEVLRYLALLDHLQQILSGDTNANKC